MFSSRAYFVPPYVTSCNFPSSYMATSFCCLDSFGITSYVGTGNYDMMWHLLVLFNAVVAMGGSLFLGAITLAFIGFFIYLGWFWFPNKNLVLFSLFIGKISSFPYFILNYWDGMGVVWQFKTFGDLYHSVHILTFLIFITICSSIVWVMTWYGWDVAYWLY